jgi:5-methylcytosine-specific restriction protein B
MEQKNELSIQGLIEEVINYSKEQASKFGATNQKIKNYVFRNNTGVNALETGGAYFGFIAPDEELSGPYHDLSFVIFPPNNIGQKWLIALGVGTLGFKNDYELAILPGLRRSYLKIIDPKNGYVKSSFIDIDSKLPLEYTQAIPEISETVSTYGKLLVASEIIDPETDDGKKKFSAFLAVYANMRRWATNNTHRTNIETAIQASKKETYRDEKGDVLDLIKQRKFLVLQGAPGTGKTRLAKLIAKELKAKTFFTQFHAETSYSDFIFGITPSVDKETLQYTYKEGVFYKALKYSLEKPQENTILIIDEINRANLANVLGPIFYLFEYDIEPNNIQILIGGDFKVEKIPENFYVIATMNTADRSLAMVDFALRRRFAWYTLYPHSITEPLVGDRKFFQGDFDAMDRIFQWYAKPEELVFQPGHSYFIAKDEDEMKKRIRYELFPLINEYFAEGILLNSKEDLIHYFRERLGAEIDL